LSVNARGRIALWLRERDLPPHRYAELAVRVRDEVATSGSPLLLRGRVDLAKALGVGVHLPADGMSPVKARSILGAEGLIGRSCHGVNETSGMAGCDYVTLSPFWETLSKPGMSGIYDVQMGFPAAHVPVYALGGLRPDRVELTRDIGCYGVAVRSYVWSSDDPRKALSTLLEKFADVPDD